MDLGLKDKVVLITGASAGIGEATAELFVQEGSNLFICGRNKEKIEKMGNELKMKYPKSVIHIMCADMYAENNCEILVNSALKIYKRIDILINNTDGPLLSTNIPEEISETEWSNVFKGKLYTYIRMINLVLPHMKYQKWGRIINIVGSVGKEPSAELLAAGVTNAGLINYIKAIAHVVGEYNVLINAVNPGHIQTSRFYKYVENISKSRARSFEAIESEILKKIPLRKLGEPHEVASLVVFLASAAASYITGVSLNVDGGMSQSAF